MAATARFKLGAIKTANNQQIKLAKSSKHKMLKKRRCRAGALLALLSFLTMPQPCSAQNRCPAAPNWNYTPFSAQNPCIRFTNGLKNLDVLPSKDTNFMPTCTLFGTEYAWISGLDSESIATIVPIFDYVNSKRAEEDAPNPGKLRVEITITNRDPSTYTTTGFENAEWKDLGDKLMSQVYDTTKKKYWGEYLVLKIWCPRGICWQLTLHDINCYKESPVDTEVYYPDANYKFLDSFNINCDDSWRLSDSHQSCITSATMNNVAPYGATDACYWKLADNQLAAPTNVHSVHLIPGITFSWTADNWGYAGVPGGSPCSTLWVSHATSANLVDTGCFHQYNKALNPVAQGTSYTSKQISCSSVNFEKIIDHVFTTGPSSNVDVIMVGVEGSTDLVYAGYFMLQTSIRTALTCANAFVCNADCVRFDGVDFSQTVTIGFLQPSVTYNFMIDIPKSCSSFNILPYSHETKSASLLAHTFNDLSPYATSVSFTIGDKESVDTVTSVDFIVNYDITFGTSGTSYNFQQNFSYTNECASIVFDNPDAVVSVPISHSTTDTSQKVTNLFDFAPIQNMDSRCAGLLKIVWDNSWDTANFASFAINTSTGELTTAVASSPAATSTTKTVTAEIVIGGQTTASKTLNIETTIGLQACTIDDMTVNGFDLEKAITIPFKTANTVVNFAVSAPASCGGFTLSVDISDPQGLMLTPQIDDFIPDDQDVRLEYGDQENVLTSPSHSFTSTWTVTWTRSGQSEHVQQTFSYTNGCQSAKFTQPDDETVAVNYDIADRQLLTTALANKVQLDNQICQSLVTSFIQSIVNSNVFSTFEINAQHTVQSQLATTATEGTQTFEININASIGTLVVATKVVTIEAQITNNCQGDCDAECVSTDAFDMKSPYEIPFNAAKTSTTFTISVPQTCNNMFLNFNDLGPPNLLSVTLANVQTHSVDMTITMGDDGQIDAFDSTSFTVNWQIVYTGTKTLINQVFSYTNACVDAEFDAESGDQVTVTHNALNKQAITTLLGSYGTLAPTICQSLVQLATATQNSDDPRIKTPQVDATTGELTTELVGSHYTSGQIDLQVNANLIINGDTKRSKVIYVTLEITNYCEGTQLGFSEGQSLLTITHDAGILNTITTEGLPGLTELTSVANIDLSECNEWRRYGLQGDAPTFLEQLDVNLISGFILSTLKSDASTTQTVTVNISINVDFYDVVSQEFVLVDNKKAQVTIKIVACEVLEQTVEWPAKKQIQVRSNAWSTPIPEWSYNEYCTGGVQTQALEFFDGVTRDALTSSDFIWLENANLNVHKTTATITRSSYIVKWTQTNSRAETQSVLVTSTQEITIELIDNCGVASLSSITPFDILDMETSVLRAYDPEQPEPGQLQTFPNSPKPTLLYDNTFSETEQPEWNTGICGNIMVIFILAQGTGQFIENSYSYESIEDRWIKVEPTINTHRNIDGYSTEAKFYFVDYQSIEVRVPFKIVVLPCEILALNLIEGQDYPNPAQYTIAQDPDLPVNIKNFQLQPSCNYSLEYTLVAEPEIEKTFITHPSLVHETFTVSASELSQAGNYTVTISIDPKLPAAQQNDYHYTEQLGTELLTRSIHVELIDPCETNEMIPTVVQVDLHLIIGVGEFFYEFPEYRDVVSLNLDEQNGIKDEDEIGFHLCGERITGIMELIGGEEWTEKRKTDDFMSIYDSQDHVIFLTYGTDDNNLAGNHLIEIDSSLAAYPQFADRSARLNLTLFEQLTDLEMPEVQFTLKSPVLPVQVPSLDFWPPLHTQIDEETGIDGGKILVTAHLKLSEDKFEELPLNIGVLDEQNMVINIECTQSNLVGDHEIVIVYTGQGYLEGQVLQTQFKLKVLPEPIEVLQFGFLGLFNLDSVELQHELEVGEGWLFSFPSYEGDGLTEVVNLGTAGKFVTYKEGSDSLEIEEGATGSANLGSHKIKKQLISEDGLVLDQLTITLQINGNLLETDGSDQDDEEDEESESEAHLNDSELEQVGAFYHELLKRRERQQQLLSIEDRKKIKPLKAQISEISETGRVDISFSNPMNVIDQLKTMNNKGILIENATRKLDESKEKKQKTKTERIDLGIFDIKVVPGGFTEAKNLGFSWEVKEFSVNKMVIQVLFENPLMVSSTPEQEQIEIKFKSEDIFTDKYGFSLTEGTTLKRLLPQQVSSLKEKEILEKTENSLKNGSQGMFAANFFLNIFYSASLQYLWDLINAQQIVILLPLFNVQTPGSVRSVFNALMAIAAFEAIPTEWIYETYFYQGDAFPINDNFKRSGFEHHLLLNNFGSLGFVLACFPLLMAALYFSEKGCSCFKRCRKRTKQYKAQMYWNAPLRVIIESYGIGCICCLLNLRLLDYDYTAKWVFTNTILTFVVALVLICFPLLALLFMYRNFDRLHDKKTKEVYGELYQGYSTDSKLMFIFWGCEYVRKLSLALVVVLTTQTFIAQMMVLFLTSLGILAISLQVRTRSDRFSAKMDIFNEVKLLLLMYHMMLFTMFVSDPVVKQNIGFSATVFLVVTTGVNMFILFMAPIKLLRRRFAIKRAQKASQIAVQKKRPDAKAYAQRRKEFTEWFETQMLIINWQIQDELAEQHRMQVIRTFNVENRRRRMHRLRMIRERGPSSSEEEDEEQPQPKEDVQAKKVNLPRPKLIDQEETKLREETKSKPAVTMINTCDNQTQMNVSGNDVTGLGLGEDSQQSMIIDTQMSQSNNHGRARRVQQKSFQASPQKPKKLTWEELERIMESQDLSIDQVEKIPGFENFEILEDTLPKGVKIADLTEEASRDSHVAPRAAYNPQTVPVEAQNAELSLQRVQEIFSFNKQRSPQRMMQQQPFVQVPQQQQQPRFHSHQRHQSQILQSHSQQGRHHHARQHSNVLQPNHHIMVQPQPHGQSHHHQRHRSMGVQQAPQPLWQQPPLQPVPQAYHGQQQLQQPRYIVDLPTHIPMGHQPQLYMQQPVQLHYAPVYHHPPPLPYPQQQLHIPTVPYGHPQQYGPQMQPVAPMLHIPEGPHQPPQQVQQRSHHAHEGQRRLLQGQLGNAPSFSRNRVVPSANLAWADSYVQQDHESQGRSDNRYDR